MKAKSESLYQLIWHTRRLFQQLRDSSDQLLAGTGINSSQRAILEFLIRDGDQTVSSMARDKNVSRQHVQKVINVLLKNGLVKALENPEHKRSPLMRVTTKGKNLFKRITLRESELLHSMVGHFLEEDVQCSIKQLQRINELIKTSPTLKNSSGENHE